MIEVKYGKRKVVSFRGNKMVVGGLTAKNKIDILLYISKEFANISNQSELFDRLLALCQEIFEVDNVTLRLWENELLRPVRFLKETSPPRRDLHSGEGFSGRVFEERQATIIADLRSEPELIDEGESTLCTICVPILYKENILGVIAIEKDIPYFYKEDDLEILEAMASQLALALNEVRLIEGLIEAQKRIDEDLKMGRNVQAQIVTADLPPWNGIHFGCYYEPMVEVSGDYFDVMRRGPSTTLLLADVSGHGVSAALVTVTIHHEFRRCVEQGMGLPEIMEALGESIRPKLPEGTYFTAQIVRVYNDQTYSMVNAGHHRLLHYVAEDADFRQIDTAGIPLGIMESRRADYPEAFGRLAPGDMLVMYTDGLTEQRDREGRELGYEKPVAWLREARLAAQQSGAAYDARDICRALIERWKDHVKGAPRGDDVTVLLAMVNPGYNEAAELFRKSRTSIAQKNPHRAFTYSTQAYQQEPSLLDNLLLLARMYYREADYNSASRYLREYVESSGERSAQIFFMLGNVYYKGGDVAAAKREFKQSLSVDFAYSDSSLMLARCYLKESQNAKALKILRQACKAAPANEQLRAALANVEKRGVLSA
ncbi:MAG: SpoIIE family protein phosphatase [Leptospirales bacterium]|nr:SpoIIE family protein phosphatase [Leptospirales bacterium]